MPRTGRTQSKGGHFSAECPPHGAGVHSPAAVPGLQGTGGLAPSTALGAARALPPLPPSRRSCAGILSWGRCPRSAHHHPRKVGSPPNALSTLRGPLQAPAAAFLAGTGELFPLQRKPGGVMARPAAAAPCPHRGRRGGEARPGGSPPPQLRTTAAAFPQHPRPWVRRSPRGGLHPTGVRVQPAARRHLPRLHARVRGDTPESHPTPQGGIPAGVSLPTGTRLRCGAGRRSTRVRSHTGVGTRGGRALARDNRRTRIPAPHPPSANTPTALPAPGALGPGRAPPLQLPSPNPPARSLPLPTPRN